MMMGYGWNNMMGGSVAGSFLFTLTWVVWLVVGVLAAVWLVKQINKK